MTKAHSTQNPERPIPQWQRPARLVLRRLRLLSLRAKYRGPWATGKEFAIGAGAVLATRGPILIGDRVGIARNFHLETALKVGNDVLISSNVSMIGNDHDFSDPTLSVFTGRRLPQAAIVLEGDNLIGFGATIIGDVRIGKGAIVGARSVVTRDVPPNTIVAGVPARAIRQRQTPPS
jgi:acetyltransferase-like isoleucine patch superfamily enzyme